MRWKDETTQFSSFFFLNWYGFMCSGRDTVLSWDLNVVSAHKWAENGQQESQRLLQTENRPLLIDVCAEVQNFLRVLKIGGPCYASHYYPSGTNREKSFSGMPAAGTLQGVFRKMMGVPSFGITGSCTIAIRKAIVRTIKIQLKKQAIADRETEASYQ